MNHIVVTYLIYLVASLLLTVWVGRTLHQNGRIFLVDAFRGNEPLADSITLPEPACGPHDRYARTLPTV